MHGFEPCFNVFDNLTAKNGKQCSFCAGINDLLNLKFYISDLQNIQQKSAPDSEIGKLKKSLEEERLKKIQVCILFVG